MTGKREADNPSPLKGVRIIDMTAVLMGPYATLILADLGADVIKIEAPEGDISRQSTPFLHPGMGHAFLNGNRNKRSVVLNLKTSEGREALLELAKTADVLVYNIRPEAMERLKLGYEDVKNANPQIIYVGGYGFSPRGRYAGRAAYDDVIQGMTGIPWMAAQASGQEPRYAPNAYADRVSSLHISNAVLAALFHRQRTGEGQRVDVPMFENMVHLLLGEHMEGETFIPPRGPMGHPRALSRDRRPYKTKDGYLCTLVYSNKHWQAFFRMIGQPERFETDQRFSSQINRIRNIDAVYGFLAEVLETRTTAEWIELFLKYDLPVGPMQSLQEVLHDPHLAEVGYYSVVEHPTEGTIRAMRYPTEFQRTPTSDRKPAPLLGEHTVEMLREIGYDDARIADMIKQGIAQVPKPQARM